MRKKKLTGRLGQGDKTKQSINDADLAAPRIMTMYRKPHV